MPIGELEEDRPSAEGGKPLSPFFVVGVSVLLIGLLMLAVQPWVGLADKLAFGLNLGLAAVLVGIGALMTWRSRREGAEAGEG